jgi:hypothetical protein
MPKHVFSVVCERASINEVNHLSLLDVIEELRISPIPVEPTVIAVAMEVMTLWVREQREVPEVSKGRLALLLPNGTELEVGQFDIDLSGPYPRTRTLGRLDRFVAQGTGLHELTVSMRRAAADPWTVCAVLHIDIQEWPTQDLPRLSATPAT